MELSIIVPVYNANKYINKCVHSILSQTFKDFELILVDDGSTDNSYELCKELEKKDNRIKVYHKENGGQGSARNFGIEHSSGEYIAFVDNDDIIHPQMYEILYNNACKYNADIVYSNYRSTYNNEEVKFVLFDDAKNVNGVIKTKDEIFNEYYGAMKGLIKMVVPWSKIVKRELYKNIKFPNLKLGEDLYVSSCLFLESKKVVFVNKELYYFNHNLSSTSRHSFDERYFDDIKALRMNYKEYVEKGYNKYASLCALKIHKRLLNFQFRAKNESENYKQLSKTINKLYRENREILYKDNGIKIRDKFVIFTIHHIPRIYGVACRMVK